ncbi:MAG: dockerin type I repeat-containing protein [Clostridia bacterium]|nr:dockerin type I repeat-containing protein [Clostridia bacterium]
MKRTHGKALALVLCMALLLAPAAALAEAERGYPDELSCEKLLAFWRQEDKNGVTNGDAVYDIDWQFSPEHYIGFGSEYPSYGGSWYTPLVFEDVLPEGFMFLFGYRVSFWDTFVTDEGYEIAVDGYEYAFPDLHGDLDLAGTNVTCVAPGCFEDYGDGVSTHIESVELDGCELLSSVRLIGQEHLNSVSALGCGNLTSFCVIDCACKDIAFEITAFEAPICLCAFGAGSVGTDCTNVKTAIAYPEGDMFLGWYENGALVSRSICYYLERGGCFTAVFSGDVDGSGTVNASDALLALRSSLGLFTPEDPAMADVNGSGAADAGDALLILRLTMGLQ